MIKGLERARASPQRRQYLSGFYSLHSSGLSRLHAAEVQKHENFMCLLYGKGMDKPFRLHGLSDRKNRVTVFGQVGKQDPSSFRDNLKAAVAKATKDSCSIPLSISVLCGLFQGCEQ